MHTNMRSKTQYSAKRPQRTKRAGKTHTHSSEASESNVSELVDIASYFSAKCNKWMALPYYSHRCTLNTYSAAQMFRITFGVANREVFQLFIAPNVEIARERYQNMRTICGNKKIGKCSGASNLDSIHCTSRTNRKVSGNISFRHIAFWYVLSDIMFHKTVAIPRRFQVPSTVWCTNKYCAKQALETLSLG